MAGSCCVLGCCCYHHTTGLHLPLSDYKSPFCSSMYLLRGVFLVLVAACFCIADGSPGSASPPLAPRGLFSSFRSFGKQVPKDPIPFQPPPPPRTRPQSPSQNGGGAKGATPNDDIMGYPKGGSKEHTTPFDADKSSFKQDVAMEALERFADVAMEIWGDLAEPETPTSTVTSFPTKSLQEFLATATAGNADNLTYYAVADLSLPSFDNAQTLLEDGFLTNWTYMLTAAEYDMYQKSPLCYFASMETMYIDALINEIDQTESERLKRSIDSRQATDDIPEKGTPEHSELMRDMYADMFATVLPYHISIMHMAEPTAKGSATAVVVSTTSCAALDGINSGVGVTTSFRKLEVVQTQAPAANNNAKSTSSPVTTDSTSSAPRTLVLRTVFLLAMVALVGCWA